MNETRATLPAFPPGRYGRRRDGRRHTLGPALLAAVTVVALTALSVDQYRRHGDPTYDAEVIRYTGITDTTVVIDFVVRVPKGGAATCALRARAYDGAEVGRRLVTVGPAPGRTQLTVSEPVTTTSRPFIGEVVRCRAPG